MSWGILVCFLLDCGVCVFDEETLVITESLLFFFLAAAAITTGVAMVVQRNPVMSAISLIGNFFCLAGLYLLLRAQLLAVLEIAVYAGAIMVLVVFVIMLLNLGNEERLSERFGMGTLMGVGLVLVFIFEMLYVFMETQVLGAVQPMHPDAAVIGTVESMGMVLFTRFLLPLQITGMLLFAAVMGALILAKKHLS
jgi:NADH-quinone oxidoreductase subunit J